LKSGKLFSSSNFCGVFVKQNILKAQSRQAFFFISAAAHSCFQWVARYVITSKQKCDKNVQHERVCKEQNEKHATLKSLQCQKELGRGIALRNQKIKLVNVQYVSRG
jgi:hypothetical protein